MTLQQIWIQLVKKCPDLQKGDTKIEFTSDNLYKLLKQVYEQGQKSNEPDKSVLDDPLKEFNKIFGL